MFRYLSFFHAIPVQVFNVATYRLKYHGTILDSEWFNPANTEAQAIRDKANQHIIEDATIFLNSNSSGTFGFYVVVTYFFCFYSMSYLGNAVLIRIIYNYFLNSARSCCNHRFE